MPGERQQWKELQPNEICDTAPKQMCWPSWWKSISHLSHTKPCEQSLFHGSFPSDPRLLGAAGHCNQSALCSGSCTYSSWQFALSCINYLAIVYSTKEVYQIYNYCFQGHNRYIGVRTGVSCYSQREKNTIYLPRPLCVLRPGSSNGPDYYIQARGGC